MEASGSCACESNVELDECDRGRKKCDICREKARRMRMRVDVRTGMDFF